MILLRSGALLVLILLCGCFGVSSSGVNPNLAAYNLDFTTPPDRKLQQRLEEIDQTIRTRLGMSPKDAAVGLLDLKRLRLAMLHPDRHEYAASIPKIGILLAWFELQGDAAFHLDQHTQHELGLMIKASSNSAATRFSREIGLTRIQSVLNAYNLYDSERGGGLWMGKHYGSGDERYGDPVANHSHAATVRQLLRFFLWLEQGKLVSAPASTSMRQIFESPHIPHDQIKFVLGLHGRDRQIIRKWGSWEDWRHDAAVVTGPRRHYILAALTHHPRGDDYLVELARAADDLMGE